MYRVRVRFQDLEDNRYQYYAGDVYPRPGLEVSEARLNALLTTSNRRRVQILESVPEDAPQMLAAEAEPPRRKRGRKRKDANGAMPGAAKLV